MALLPWTAAVLSLLLFGAAAKTHGRQIRLEREARGHMEVVFGTGTNPAFVEALWRRDRIRFWSLTPILAAIALALTTLPLVPPDSQPLAGAAPDWGRTLLATLLWAPTATFLSLAILSARRLGQDLRSGNASPPTPSWRREAARGSGFWFAVCAVLALGLAVTSYV